MSEQFVNYNTKRRIFMALLYYENVLSIGDPTPMNNFQALCRPAVKWQLKCITYLIHNTIQFNVTNKCCFKTSIINFRIHSAKFGIQGISYQ